MAKNVPKRMPLWQFGLLQGTVFGTGWGLIMYHLSWKAKGASILGAVGFSIFAGVLFAAMLTWFEARRRRTQDESSSQNQ